MGLPAGEGCLSRRQTTGARLDFAMTTFHATPHSAQNQCSFQMEYHFLEKSEG